MASLYGPVLVLHIASIAVALGAVASQPLVLRTARREAPGSVAAVIRAQRLLGNAVIAPAGTITLVTGLFLATVGGFWDELWVSLPLALLVFVLALHGAWVAPTERRLEALAGLAEDGPGGYEAVARRLTIARYGSGAAILLALGLMVLKP